MAATSETIQDCIKRRLGVDKMIELVIKHGFKKVEGALDFAGSFHSGCEEIGSSDIYYFTRTFLRELGEEVK